MKTSLSRRDFLKSSLAAAGLGIAVSITPFGTKLLNAKEAGKAVFAPGVWYEVTPDNRVTVYIPQSEMGQGVRTALAMIVADELDVEWKQVRVRESAVSKAFTNPLMGDQITVASASVRGFYEPIRKAGAAGRAMLVKAAADTWKVPEGECEASKGVVRHTKSRRRLTYGRLCAKAAALPVIQDAPLKKESAFRYIGRAMPRLDIPEKVAGTGVYGADVTLPDMLYAVLAFPPAFGAKPASFDKKAAMAVKGVRKVFPSAHGVAVCADSTDAAIRGRDALNVQWGKGAMPDMDDAFVEKHFMEELDKPGAVAGKRGDAKSAVAGASKKVEAVYYVPAVAHVCMEPMNCTVHVQKDRMDVWAPNQAPSVFRMVGAQVAGVPPEKVNVHTTLLGGGFGRRAAPDFMIDAIIASKVTGRPVKVLWSREHDIKGDLFRAPTCQRITAGLDGGGRLAGWSHKVVSPSLMKNIDPKAVVGGVDFMSLWGIADFPGSPHNNVFIYEVPDYYLEFLIDDLPIPVAPWRSVQNGPNAFVTECFIDELAHAAGKDAVTFRLEHLQNTMRARRVLETAAQKAGWDRPAGQGRAWGIAQHACFGTYVAQAADVSVNRSGKIKVHKVIAAVDCGPVVNPGTLVAQIEGAIIMALGTVYREQVRFAKGGVQSANFNDYKIMTMSKTPQIEVHIVRSTEKMGGIGEPGVPPLAPAVANAVFAATGARVRRLPLTPENVLEAMKKKEA
jgi:isoquinoline 1-oxidoreductase beta subunit